MKSMGLWKDRRLWHFIFAARLHQSLRKMYTGQRAARWDEQTAQELADLEAAEWGYTKTQALTISARMVRLSLGMEFVEDFIDKVCFMGRVAPAEQKELMALIEALPQHEGTMNAACTPPPELSKAARVVLWIDSKHSQMSTKHHITMDRKFRNAVPKVVIVVFRSLDTLDDWLTQYSDFLVPKLRVVVNRAHDVDARTISVRDTLLVLRDRHGLTEVPLVELLSRKTLSESEVAHFPPTIKHVYHVTSMDHAAQWCAN